MKRVSLLIVLIPISLLSACNNDSMSDLKNYITKKKNSIIDNRNTKPPTEIPHLTSISYNAKSRTPFEVTAAISSSKKIIEPLNAYSLNTLQYVGTITEVEKRIAIIITPDKLTYKVKVGDTIGDHYGKIISIEPDKIEIMETYTGNENGTTQRMVTLQLKDER